MKNNNILILLLSTLGVGILCAIIASIAFTYYNGGFGDLTNSDSTSTKQAIVAENQLSELDTSTQVEEIRDSSNDSGVNYLALVPLMQKSQTCSSSLMILGTSMAMVQINPSILDDEQNSADIQTTLEDTKTSCDKLGDNDEIADYFPKIARAYVRAEKSIDKAIENYEDYFTYNKTTYIDQGNIAYEEAQEYLGNAFELLQETMTEEAP